MTDAFWRIPGSIPIICYQSADRSERGSHLVGDELAASEFSRGSTTRVSPLFQVDDGFVFNRLPLWAPDAAVRKKILLDWAAPGSVDTTLS